MSVRAAKKSLCDLASPNVSLTDSVSGFAEELEDSTLSSSEDNQAEQPAPTELPSLPTSSVYVSDPDIQPADPPHLHSERAEAPSPASEPSSSPPAITVTPSVAVEEAASTPPPVDLLQFSGTCEPTEGGSPGQDREGAPAESRVEPPDDPRSREQDGEEPEE